MNNDKKEHSTTKISNKACTHTVLFQSTRAANQQIRTTKIPNSRDWQCTQRNPGTADMQTLNSGTFTGEGIRRTLVACECQLHVFRRRKTSSSRCNYSHNRIRIPKQKFDFKIDFDKVYKVYLCLKTLHD